MRGTAIVVLILQQPELQRRKKSLLYPQTGRPTERAAECKLLLLRVAPLSLSPARLPPSGKWKWRGGVAGLRRVTSTVGQIVVRFGECNAF